MINYLLMIFGINCKNKLIGTFLTGITLSIFSLIMVQTIVHISFGDEIEILIFKISSAIVVASKIISFIPLKFKSTKIFELYDRLIDYQIKSYIKYNNHYISTVIFILFTIIATWISTAIYFYDSHFGNIHKGLIEKQENLPISQKSQIILISFYVNAWNFLLQIIFYEFNNRYISIINAFNQEIDRKVSKPDNNVIVLSQRTVLKFNKFQSDIKKNVDFVKYFIIIDTFSMALIMIYVMFCVPNRNMQFKLFSFAYLILMAIYFFWTMNSGLKVGKVEKEMVSKLNRWKELESDENTFIEMRVLERTVDQFEGNVENIEAEYSV